MSLKIAIFGATSQIARDLILSFSNQGNCNLFLFARRPDVVVSWLEHHGLLHKFPVAGFDSFNAARQFDCIINFVGSGNPAQVMAMGASIFDVTLSYDEMVLDYLHHHPACRYLFLSSGAAYCSSFSEPVDETSKAEIPINNIKPSDWYAVAKLHAECRHRSLRHLSIVDIRIFNYFSHTQDISARFFITDILRAIRAGETLITSASNIVRDYIGPMDFSNLVSLILDAPSINIVIDSYTRSPIDKLTLLSEMRRQFGLKYDVTEMPADISATGNKLNYFSRNRRAEIFGYAPSYTSLETVLNEARLYFSYEDKINFRHSKN